jgi:hypothetical protein
MPAALIVVGFEFGILSPHYMSWFLGSQATAPPAVHIARLGGELTIPPRLALTATVPVLLLVQVPPSLPSLAVSVLSILVVAATLGFGWATYRRVLHRDRDGRTARVAVVAAAPEENDYGSPAYHDIDGLVARCYRRGCLSTNGAVSAPHIVDGAQGRIGS